ncbi:MAG: c-type cytochrome, partial [Acidobacteria bacterium]|nr:c-type cytochrome [Acidobacteriota bacterium]
MPDHEQDPVVHSSLSKPLFVSAALLIVTLAWALWDEIYITRPWKRYQARFVKAYSGFLASARPDQAQLEKRIRASGEFQKLEKAMQAAEQRVASQVAEIDREINQLLVPQTLALNEPFQEARLEIAAVIYEIETAGSEKAKDDLRARIARIRKRTISARLPQPDGSLKSRPYTYESMERDLDAWKARKAQLLQQRVVLLKPATELRAQRDQYLAARIAEVSAETLAGIERRLDEFSPGLRQIHIKDVDLVDRCESCHLGIREPVTLTRAAMSGEAAFTSHPNRELLTVHDPERFGCTPCHGGNGVATSSVTKAHGRHKFWPWPMHHPENFEAGCQQCHSGEIVTEMAPVLNQGREIFRLRGCNGCHRYEGYDREPEELMGVSQQIRQHEQQKAEWTREAGFAVQKGDRTRDNAEAQRLYAHADNLKVRMSGLDAKLEQLDMRSRNLVREIKKIGPSLKEVRMKLRKEWIPLWLKDPNKWRPGTKMPTFRLDDGEIRAISAFIWQSGLSGRRKVEPEGDPEKGREAFETRGCLGCHSMGEGGERQGGTFAANLSREGEKANYDYLVRWIHNPRERTAPYCPFEKRDLTGEDYRRKGLAYVFDDKHSRCPNDGHELQFQQMTPMPSLRLTVEESRDIASYMMTRKAANASYPAADFMDDTRLQARGQFLVRFYGCAGCHEISGLEEEQRIGTELTREGSKWLERLDFALLGHQAQKEGWYTHKGFFERKIADPAIYDQGKEKSKLDQLKMPNFNLSKPDIDAVTAFLIGSVEPNIPERYHYRPTGQRQDIIEGWWVIRRYNCMGCHQVQVGQKSAFDLLPRYQDPDWKEQKPPSLIGEGARVNPHWLMQFLSNPAMHQENTNRNGVRQYLRARMPTF